MSKLIPFNRNRNIGPDSFYSMLDDFFSDAWLPGRSLTHDTFKVDVREDDKEYLIDAEMPGVRKGEIDLQLNDGRLTINVTRDEVKEEKDKKFIHKERRYSSMSRSIYLEDAANEGISAKLEDGVLKIAVPREQKAHNVNRIEIE